MNLNLSRPINEYCQASFFFDGRRDIVKPPEKQGTKA
jgi:hypothetical protein